MPHNKFSRRKRIGASPGSMIFLGEQKTNQVKIELISFNSERIETQELPNVDDIASKMKPDTINWLNISGLHDSTILEKTGKLFSIHSLILEDILNTDQRPKIEIMDEYIFIVLKTISYSPARRYLDFDQVSLVFGKNHIITFQEKPSSLLDPLKERLLQGKRARYEGSDYLAYSIVDIIVDNYFLALENMAEVIEDLEERAMSPERDHLVSDMHQIKRDLLLLRKSVWPMREVANLLLRDNNPLFQPATLPYIHDLYDHIIQIMDTVEGYRDMIASLQDIYLSSVSLKMNDIMKTLTIISTIFMPLTFIVGIYGMNFEYMPELKLTWSYPAIWCVFIAVVLTMLYYFRRRKWL